MRVQVQIAMPFALHRVFSAHRDDLDALGLRLPGVQRIETVSRTRDESGALVLEHRWYGDPGLVPRALRHIVTPDRVTWADRTVWCERTMTGRWELELPMLAEAARVYGTHTFRAADGGTEVSVEGHVEVSREALDAMGISPMFRLLIPALERFTAFMMQTILGRSGPAVEQWLLEQEGAREAA